MNRVLLDTNAYTSFLEGDDLVLETMAESGKIYLSVFVLGELFAGFNGGNKRTENLSILNRFLQKPSVEIVSSSLETAKIFGEIKHQLKSTGTPIPINDVWIAAHTFETGSVLVSYDKHFRSVHGLRVWDQLM